MIESPLLSIIMPCYNGASTIRRALDSIFEQCVDFDFEVLIIDDGSEDESVEIIEEYAKIYSEITLIKNNVNLGNAKTFYKGLSMSRGKYFCVLDVDDYYSLTDKLKRQISFLERDIDEEYVAVTHHYAIDLQNDKVHIPDVTKVNEFNYIDFLNQRSGYYHTATYMYRNIFRGNVPKFFNDAEFRGDTVRTAIHLMYSNRKVKVLNFIGSVYTWSNKGIWTSMSQRKQFDLQIKIWTKLMDISTTDVEREAYNKLIEQCVEKQKKVDDSYRTYKSISVDWALTAISRYAGKYAFERREYIFKGIYYSEYIDSLSATLGKIYRLNHPEIIQTEFNKDRICIFVSTLKPRGGGIFREIEEIIKMFSEYSVHIISTERAASDPTAKELLSQHENLCVHFINPEKNKIEQLSLIYKEISPFRSYYYDPHDDPHPGAIMQNGGCQNIGLFSYDHGFVCGLSNPLLHSIICKRPLDYEMLNRKFSEKIIYIPAWNDISDHLDNFEYVPFRDHDSLITACGSARFYKLDSGNGPSYVNLILNLLKKTGGQHYHYGPIPNDVLEYINSFVRDNDLREDAFVYVEWSDDPIKLMIDNKVDLFIEPFPIVSYKITLDVLMIGLPIIAHRDHTRMSTVDFIYPNNLIWNTEDDFIQQLSNITPDVLEKHSALSKKYFENTHCTSVLKPYYIENKGFPVDSHFRVCDNYIHDIIEYEKMFTDGHITLASDQNNGNRSAIQHEKSYLNSNSTVSILRTNSRVRGIADWMSNIIRTEPTLLHSVRRMIGEPLHKLLDLIDHEFKRKKARDNSVKKPTNIDKDLVKNLFNSSSRDDNQKAFKICEDLKRSDLNAEIWLARMYRDGKGVKQNLNKSVEHYRKSIDGGFITAKNELVDVLLKRKREGDLKEAFEIASEFMNDGNMYAAGRVARMYKTGTGVEQDKAKAIEIMRLAADNNVSWAKIEMIDLLLDVGGHENITEAFDRCLELAQDGDSGASGRLARLYGKGIGTEKNIDDAIFWMRIALEKNVSWARLGLTELLLERGNSDDLSEARSMCIELAERGSGDACVILARMYRDGDGVDVDLDCALKWMNEAIKINKSWETGEYLDLIEQIKERP